MILPSILASLSPEDRVLYAQARAALRREYLGALAHIAGADHYDETDDRILDALDIRVHSMFARAGRLVNSKTDEKTGNVDQSQTGNGTQAGGNGTGVADLSAGGVSKDDLAKVQEEMARALGESGTTATEPAKSPWIAAKA